MNPTIKKCSLYKENSDTDSNLFERFIVLGLNLQIIHNNYLYNTPPSVLNKTGKIKPEIISQFPSNSKSDSTKEDSIIKVIFYMIKHCFPKGFSIIESSKPLKPEAFFFSLDNDIFNETGSKKYFTCLTFYETLESYNNCFQMYKDIAMENPFHESNHDIFKPHLTNLSYTLINYSKVFKNLVLPKTNTINIRNSNRTNLRLNSLNIEGI
jgi:hypothetical protein